MAILIALLITSTDIFDTEETRNYDVIVAETDLLKARPLDINSVPLEELMKIPFLSPADCLRIIAYREDNGRIGSWDELIGGRVIDRLTAGRVRPFFTFSPKKRRTDRIRSRLRSRRLAGEPGTTDYYTRNQLVLSDGHDLFLVTEQDAGEESFLDYWTGGFLVSQGTRRFALGAYDLDMGSGVMLSSVGSIFRSADFRVASVERGIMPYLSVMENNGFFGAAFSDSLAVPYTLFFSSRKLDGRVDSTGSARSLDPSGDHADSAGLAGKDRISEEIMGYDVRYGRSGLSVSHRSYVCTYSPDFATDDSLYDFYGRRFWMSGLGTRYHCRDFILFSEAARADHNRLGGIFGFGGVFPRRIEFSVAGKFFPRGFYSPKGVEAAADLFGMTVDVSQVSAIARLGANINVDRKTGSDSSSYDLKVNFEKNLSVIDSKIQLRWRFVETARELSGARIFVRFRPLRRLFCDVRLEEKIAYLDPLEKGACVAFDLVVDTGPVDIKTRYGLFDTDSYRTRTYVYEPDLPGTISNRILYGQGQYGLLLLSARPRPWLAATFRYLAINKADLERQIGMQIDLSL